MPRIKKPKLKLVICSFVTAGICNDPCYHGNPHERVEGCNENSCVSYPSHGFVECLEVK